MLMFIIEQIEENMEGDFIDKNMELGDYDLCSKQTLSQV